MTWKQLLAENRVAAEPTSRTEIKDLRTVVLELGLMPEDELDKALDVLAMTRGGVVGG